MTRALTGAELAEAIQRSFPSSVVETQREAVVVAREAVRDICFYLKESPELDFSMLTSVTAVDYVDYFEVVYHLVSLSRNQSAILKARAPGRADPWVPSVVPVWQGADFQERETWDLLGVRFDGHPSLRRILLWDGFPGHPLRKDFLEFDHRTVPAATEPQGLS
ncbi:MAG: NADH-quinone oxidoreductase subunit C [Chloroflexi bacterium]|nr:NADH-quinone oxidoreductase subunit C [Chloroflexota bacterium]